MSTVADGAAVTIEAGRRPSPDPGPPSSLGAQASGWQLRGRCRTQDAGVFFYPDNDGQPKRKQRDQAAKAVCARCPVSAECAAHALATGEPHGVWGGFTQAERRRLLITGWQDLADPGRTRVDVTALRARLAGGA